MTRKTEQAIKVSASWTPNGGASNKINAAVFGRLSPLAVRGGRLTINAAIATDHADPVLAARVAQRIAELRRELEATGTVHSFVTQAGAVPAGSAERLPDLPDGGTVEGGGGLVGEAAA
jgi:hypothetical protein